MYTLIVVVWQLCRHLTRRTADFPVLARFCRLRSRSGADPDNLRHSTNHRSGYDRSAFRIGHADVIG